VRGNPILEWQQIPQPLQARLPELLDCNKSISTANYSAHHENDNLSERVDFSMARIIQLREAVDERRRAGNREIRRHRNEAIGESGGEAPVT
jgi:hypothetical protein